MFQNSELAAGAEQYSHDPGTKYVYLGIGEMDPDHYVSEASLAGGPGGNCIYLPSIDRYYVGVPQHGKTDDQILV